MLFVADDSWFAWPWSMYSSGDDEDVISVPTQIKSLKHRIGKNLNHYISKIEIEPLHHNIQYPLHD